MTEEKSYFNKIENTIYSIDPMWVILAFGILFSILALAILIFTGTAGMVDEPFFGGLFNMTFWGFQVYLFLVVPAFILYFAAFAYWVYFKWGMMTPFHGLWAAVNSQSEVIFKCDLKLNFILLGEFAAKVIFDKDRYNSLVQDTTSALTRFRMWLMPVDQAVHIAKHLQGSWDSKPMTNIGSIPASILIDIFGWTNRISPTRTEISNVVDGYNDMNPEDQIHGFSKAWKYMNEGKIQKPNGVDLFATIPWVRIDNAYPPKRYQAERGGFIRQLALNMINGLYNKGFNMTTAGILIFIVCVIFSIVMFAMKIFIHAPVK